MFESKPHIQDIIAYLTCKRRVYYSAELPKKRVSKTIMQETEALLSRHWKDECLLQFLYPENSDETEPLFLIQRNGIDILLLIDTDPLFFQNENQLHLLLQYAMRQWNFQHGVAVQIRGNLIIETKVEEIYHLALASIGQKIDDVLESPKTPSITENTDQCDICPMRSLCLPFLHTETPEKRRTLLPKKEFSLPFIIGLPRGKLRKRKGEMLVENDTGKIIQKVRFHELSSVIVEGNITVTTPLLHELSTRGISVHYHDEGGWYKGSFQPVLSHNIMARVRQYQVAFNLSACLKIVCGIVASKIQNQRTLLLRSTSLTPKNQDIEALKQNIYQAKNCLSLATLRGIEGNSARIYFQHFSKMLHSHNTHFQFKERNRRPPKDPINAMLSFGYACLYRECIYALQQVGLDPYMGYLHTPQSGRASLALDIMEEFRPIIIDTVVLKLINNKQLKDKDFIITSKGVWFRTKAKDIFLRTLEKKMISEIRHPLLQVRLSYRRCIQAQCQLLVQTLSNPDIQYKGFTV